MILGWSTDKTPTQDQYYYHRGGAFVDLMKGEYPDDTIHHKIRDAWYLAGFYGYTNPLTLPPTDDVRYAVFYRTTGNDEFKCKDDHLPGYGEYCTNPLQQSDFKWESYLIREGTTSAMKVNSIVNGSAMIYKIENKDLSRENMTLLARSLGITGEIIANDEIVSSKENGIGDNLFIVRKNPSTIFFRNTTDRKGIPDNENDSIMVADSFLEKNDLQDQVSTHPRVVSNFGKLYSSSGTFIKEWRTNVIVYSRLIDGLPSIDDQLNVEVDSEGNVVGFIKNWRDLKPFREVQLKSPEQAFLEFSKENSSREKSEKISRSNMTLGYHTIIVNDEEYLVPYYIFKGGIRNSDDLKELTPVFIKASDGDPFKFFVNNSIANEGQVGHGE